MGWYGNDIMDGDVPLDYAAEIRDICCIGSEQHPGADELPEFTEQVLYDHEDEIALRAETIADPIFYQVWGWLLVEAQSKSLRDDRREAILRAIDTGIDRTEDRFGWVEPHERRFHLRLLRERVRAMGMSNVVRIDRIIKQRLHDEVSEAMQVAFENADLTDPSVVQRAVARFLDDLTDGVDFNDWGVAAQAIVNVGQAMAKGIHSGVTTEQAVAIARPLTGA